mgnify:CR=1 FL=1
MTEKESKELQQKQENEILREINGEEGRESSCYFPENPL